jgi:hypothetical protein
MADYILAEFKGTYRAPHPEGIKDAKVAKQFHVKVKMLRDCLSAPGLKGLFHVFYLEHLRKNYPDLVDTYKYDLVQATEIDGTEIDSPKALNYDGLLKYIAKRRYPINASLYSPAKLRNEIVLYEQDAKGQQFLEQKLMARKGSMLAIAAELQNIDDIMTVVQPAPRMQVPTMKR